MRRWLPWTIAGGVVVILAVGAAALIRVPPPAPYKFLKGRMGVEFDPPADSGSQPFKSTVYSFEGDFRKVLEAATRELKTHGLSARKVNDEVRFYRFDPDRPHLLRGTTLSIWQDTAYGRSDGWSKRRGWVSVKVEGTERPSWLDNFTSWLGF